MKEKLTVEEFLTKRIKECNGYEDVNLDESFEYNGVDSLEKVEISIEVEKEFNLKFQDYIIYDGMKTVRDWIEYIESEMR